ncbi:MAG: NAD-dependent epimerase/dehydratase family protein [Flavobacteriales bacterium]
MKNILITGGSGFIARYFIEKLSDHRLVNLDKAKPADEQNIDFIQADIRDKEAVIKASEGSDLIIHLAAMHHDFGISEDAYFDVNVNGAKVVAEAAAINQVKEIIFFSSVAVYGALGLHYPTHEQMNPIPNSPYGHSKLQAEKVLEEWALREGGRKVTVIRSTVVFGAWNLANVLNLIKAIDRGIYFHIGKGRNIKSLAYVENIVDASLFALENQASPFEIFNYVDEPQMDSRSIANMQAEMLGKKICITLPLWFAIALALPFDLLIRISGKNLPISSKRVKKLCTQTWHGAEKIRTLGFKARHSIPYGMQKMIDWYKTK